MKITERQFDALRGNVIEMYIKRLTAFLATKCDLSQSYSRPERVLTGTDFESRVRTLVARARAHNLRTELGIATFAIICLSYSDEFDSIPTVKAILSDCSRKPEDNIKTIIEMIISAEARQYGFSR